jgi:hypothetical protein
MILQTVFGGVNDKNGEIAKRSVSALRHAAFCFTE